MFYRLLITDGLHGAGLDLLRASPLVSLELRSGVTQQELQELAPHFDGLIIHVATPVNAKVMQAAAATAQGRLRFIGCASVGFDHVDLKAAKQHGVVVESAAGANAGSVGDLALGLLISMARRLPEARESLSKNQWDRKTLTGFALSEKVLGLLGAGNTGQAMAQRARACGMRVVAYDPKYPPGSVVDGVSAFLESKESILKSADVVSLHVPRQPDTVKLIDRLALCHMKPGSYLINTSRGGIACEVSIREALDAGTLAGYGTDVFETEPLPEKHWLRTHPLVVATPHLGGATEAARRAVAHKIAQLTLDYFGSLKKS